MSSGPVPAISYAARLDSTASVRVKLRMLDA